jgi:hypothetical protein
MDVTDARAALVVGGGIRFVDVSDLAGFGVENFAVNLELFGNLLELLFLIRHRRLGFDFRYLVFRVRMDAPFDSSQSQTED